MASRVAKNPVSIPGGVDVKINGLEVTIKGKLGQLQQQLNKAVAVAHEDNELKLTVENDADKSAHAQAGTARALLQNMVTGVSEGFERKLIMKGVGYRAQAKGKTLSITAGFSHPVEMPMPEGITVETPAATEIVVKGIDKRLVGQVAANIRAVRPPEPYKGKGIRYADEHVVIKEAKKK